jgi:TRAP-type C4-dicarboxylate transport system permease small subunit
MQLPKLFGRKGYSLTSLWVAGLGFVITVVVLSIGARIVSEMKNQTTDTTAVSILEKGLVALSDLSAWLPIIALAVAGVIILLLIVRAFGGLGMVTARGE